VAHDVRIEVRSDNDLTVTVDGPKPPLAAVELVPEALSIREYGWALWVAWLVAAVLGAIGLVVALRGFSIPDGPSGNTFRIAGLLLAVAFLGHAIVEVGSALAVRITNLDGMLRANLRKPAAYVGMVERPLLLSALAFGQPGFFAVWYAYKALGRWKDREDGAAARQTLVMHLLHSALSLAAVAVAWAVWRHLGLSML
jgi:hypothetical protein